MQNLPTSLPRARPHQFLVTSPQPERVPNVVAYREVQLAHFVGPKTLGSKRKLVVQDSFFYLTNNVNLLYDSPPNSWCTSHPSKEGVRAFPYYVHKDLGGDDFPRFRFNAGFLDGHVESFMSWEALKVKNYGAINYLAQEKK